MTVDDINGKIPTEGVREVQGECACEVCGEKFYEGDHVHCIHDNEDDTLRWFCPEHTPSMTA
jgi:hypothetical protein